MTAYILKIVSAQGEKQVVLEEGKTTKIAAEFDTHYQIFDQNGHLVSQPQATYVGEDLAISLEGSDEPALVLEHYNRHYPIENPDYLLEAQSSFATSNQTFYSAFAEPVFSVEVATPAALFNPILYGLGGLAATGIGFGLTGAFKKGRGSKPSEQQSLPETTESTSLVDTVPTTDTVVTSPAQPENPRPINLSPPQKRDETVTLPADTTFNGTLIIDDVLTHNLINAEAAAGNIVITGRYTLDPDVKAGSIHITINGKQVELDEQAGSWRVEFAGSELSTTQGAQQLVGTLNAEDRSGNRLSITTNKDYRVDTELTAPTITLNPIATDDIINAVEAREPTITVSGKVENVTNSAAKPGDKVLVAVGGATVEAELDNALLFSVPISTLALVNHRQIELSLTTLDDALNTNTTNLNRTISVDTQINKPIVTITSIAGDDVIDAQEAAGSILIKGTVQNAEGDGPVVVKCPCTTCSSGWKEVEVEIVNGQFEVSVKVSDSSLASARLKSIERKVKANYTAKDDAGNTSAADEASRDYRLDLQREIDITKIGEHFDLSPSATTRIYGKVTEFGTLNNVLSDAYNQGMNARLIRMVKLVIGEKSYQVGFNSVNKTFFVDIPNSELPELSGKTVSLDFTAPLTANRAVAANYYGNDTVVNILQVRADGSKSVGVARGLVPTAKKFTLESDILVQNGENSYSVKNLQSPKTEISGIVKGNIAAGAEIDVQIGNQTITTQVQQDKTFKVEVDSQTLQNNTSPIVTATLKSDATIQDAESYHSQGASSALFSSKHGLTARGNRKIDHRADDYNFFHPIHLIEMNAGRGGFLDSYNPSITQAPKVIKYHFVTDAEISQMPTNIQGFEITQAGTRKAAPAALKPILQKVYAEISKSTNLVFEEVPTWQEASAGNGTLIFAGTFTGYAKNSPAIGFGGGNIIWSGSVGASDSDYTFQTAMHEVLHTLSLDHTHVTFLNSATNSSALTFRGEETMEFSNLSYYRPRLMLGMRDLRMFDQAYLHYRFGVNSEHRKGNDVYTFKTYDALKSDGDIYVWDGNGIDTFDASAEKEGVNVNLTPGSWNYRGTERKKNFIVEDRTDYDLKTFFGLANNETVAGKLDNRATTYYGGDVQVPDGKIQFANYIFDGQSFIGYGTQIENLIGSDFKDTLTGNNADNNIFGGAGDDTISGGLGNDFLNGGLGDDLLFGQEGNDSYVVDSAGDVVTEYLDQGTDHIYSTINYILDNHVENLTLTGTRATQASGNALNNIITGNDTGNTLNGLEGNDRLIGGLGTDILTGGAGEDTFVFASSLNGKADTVTDFVIGQDKIELSSAIFTSLRQDLSNLTDHLFLDQDSGEIRYNAANTGADNATHFVTITGLTQLDQSYFNVV